MRLRTVLTLLLLPILAACEPGEDTTALVLSLELEVSQAALEIDPDAPLRDDLGLFDLPLIAAYVALEVTASDMAPVTAEWPAWSSDLADFAGTAVVEIEVTPGDARSLDGVVLSWDTDRARLYAPPAPLLMDVEAGAVEDVELVLEESPYGTIAGTAPEGAVSVEVVDQVTDVILRRVVPDDAGAFELDGLPVQRPLYPVWDFGDAGRTPAPDLATHIPGAGGGATFPSAR